MAAWAQELVLGVGLARVAGAVEFAVGVVRGVRVVDTAPVAVDAVRGAQVAVVPVRAAAAAPVRGDRNDPAPCGTWPVSVACWGTGRALAGAAVVADAAAPGGFLWLVFCQRENAAGQSASWDYFGPFLAFYFTKNSTVIIPLFLRFGYFGREWRYFGSFSRFLALA